MKNPPCFLILISWLTLSWATAGELSNDFFKLHKNGNVERTNNVRDLFPAERVDPGIIEIDIERSGCFGTCPIYTAKLFKNGTIEYVGEKFVKRKGTFTAHIFPYLFNNVAEFSANIGFKNLKPLYTTAETDSETVYTRVTYSDKTVKIVSNYADCGPIALWAFQELIDKAVLEATDWKQSKSAE